MKKRVILSFVIALFMVCFFAISISAATTNEFGTLETSTTIDLEGMSTDTKARVVLFDGTEYHTYPAQYIVTSAGDMAFNFEKINTAFQKSYALNSVIRIEVPNTVKVVVSGLFNYGKNNNLKEVYFPSDSQVYKFNWGCFEQNTGLEKINIPASLTEYNGTNHFAKCKALKEVTFDEGYSVSAIPNNFFQDCSSLEKLVFPNCVTSIGNGAFAVCSNLKTIVFGANLQTMGGPMSDCSTSGSVWYLPATFYASNVTSEPPSNMFHWAGTQTNGVSGNSNNPKNITFVFTGTKEQALALQARFKAADAATGEGCVGLSRLYDAILCTEAEYETLTGKKVGESATGYYLVYGYNKCDAFYGKEHKEGAVERKFEGAPYVTNYVNASSCERCGKNFIVGDPICGPLFQNLGYSRSNDGTAFAYGISLNDQNISAYKAATGEEISYGFILGLAGSEAEAGKIVSSEGEALISNSIVTNFANVQYEKLNVYYLKATKIETEAQRELNIYCNAYVIENGVVSYIGEVNDSYLPVAIKVKDLPVKE